MTRKRMKIEWLLTVVLSAALFAACGGGSDDPVVPDVPSTPQPLPTLKPGTISVQTDGSEATPDHPATATSGKPATVMLTQRSQFEDPNGTVYTCEPKATVSCSVGSETVQAKSLAEALDIKETGNATTANGTNPTTKTTEQTFTVGGQTISFKMTHEVYSYNTSDKRTVEMPYVRLSAAKQGTAPQATETRFAVPTLTGIRLEPVEPQTRFTHTTHQLYRVRASFTVDAETMNTASPEKRTLSFEADYYADVEDTQEYPDPTTSYVVHTVPVTGTTGEGPQFVMQQGAQEMKIEWQQEYNYTWFDLSSMATQLIKREPKASVQLKVKMDTLMVKEAEDLLKQENTGSTVTALGDNPQTTTGSHVFHIGGQEIETVWIYEAYPAFDANGDTHTVPHIEFGEPSVADVKAVAVDGKEGVYDVTVTIKQEMRILESAEPKVEVLEYVAKYAGVVEPKEIKLVKVVYRKGYDWEEPHDNIMLNYEPIVYRDRIYSNGKTLTDTFRGKRHFTGLSSLLSPYESDTVCLNEGALIYHNLNYVNKDSVLIRTSKVGVPKLDNVEEFLNDRDEYSTKLPGDWSAYRNTVTYNGLDITIDDDVEVIGTPNDSVSDKKTGWYFLNAIYHNEDYFKYKEPEDEYSLFTLEIENHFKDMFMVLDGRMIRFSEFIGPIQIEKKAEMITMPNGQPARVYSNQMRQLYLGRNMYIEVTDTVYQLTEEELRGAMGTTTEH